MTAEDALALIAVLQEQEAVNQALGAQGARLEQRRAELEARKTPPPGGHAEPAAARAAEHKRGRRRRPPRGGRPTPMRAARSVMTPGAGGRWGAGAR